MSHDQSDIKKTFCPLPWTYMSIRPNGQYRVCSVSQSSASQGNLLKPDGTSYRADLDSFEDVRNSEIMKKLRARMLAGQTTPEICQRCIQEEAHGLESRRLNEVQRGLYTLNQARNVTKEDGSISNKEVPVSGYDLRFGNTCNLKCRMCYPALSTKWYEEWYKTRHSGFNDSGVRYQFHQADSGAVILDSNDYQWFESPGFFDFMVEHIKEIRRIHFSGGEPLLLKEHLKLIQALVEMGVAKDIEIDYNTNLTVLPAKIIDLWSCFKKVGLGVSIDAVGPLNNYIRHPSRFKEIEANLRMIDESPDNIRVWLTSTLMWLNIARYPELLRWLLTSEFRKVNRVTAEDSKQLYLGTHFLHNPKFLSAKILPKSFKKTVSIRMRDFLLWHNDKFSAGEGISGINQHIDSVVSFMNSEDWSHLIPEAVREVDKSDQFRGEKLSQVEADVFKALTETSSGSVTSLDT